MSPLQRDASNDNGPAVLVSGASGGIGAAIANWLAVAGASVTLLARREEALDGVAREVRERGGRALTVACDVSDAAGCRRAVEAALERFGRLDALVNNAGVIGPIAPVEVSDPEQWRRNLAVNILGPYHLTRFALPELRRRGGRIVNVGSGAGTRAMANLSAYCTAKAALNHFTRVLAAEAPEVAVLAVRPGVVDTPMQAALRSPGAGWMSDEQRSYYRGLKQSGALEPPEVPAKVIAWLALRAPLRLSGEFLNYDDPPLRDAARRWFGHQRFSG
jgi:NAD(P)-dependent dehydrogenase (short-subunit alcohol dehydrogenase family)